MVIKKINYKSKMDKRVKINNSKGTTRINKPFTSSKVSKNDFKISKHVFGKYN